MIVKTIYDNPIVEHMPKSTRMRFKTHYDLQHTLINREGLYIHAPYVSNGASVPRLLWWIYPPIGSYTNAAIVHDYLYEKTLYDREFADIQFLIDMKACGTNIFTRYLFFTIVRIFGGINWNKFKKNGSNQPKN
jgi:hypothetical protein